MSCLIVLMDGTFFDAWPGAINCFQRPPKETQYKHLQFQLDAGDMLVFRGDFVHGGAPSEEFNIRIHTFLDVPSVKRMPDTTFYMDEEDWILPRNK